MNDDIETRREFAAMINATVSGIYGKPELEKPVLRMWFVALARFDLDDVRQALGRHVTDPDCGQYVPKPADIVRHIEGGSNTGAAIAWSKVSRALRLVGAYSTVVFDEPAIHAAIVDCGGWVELCRVTTDELPHLQRRFEAAYRAHRQRGTTDVPPKLAGITEITNAPMGFLPPEPVLIGDVDACQRLLAHEPRVGLTVAGELNRVMAGLLS